MSSWLDQVGLFPQRHWPSHPLYLSPITNHFSNQKRVTSSSFVTISSSTDRYSWSTAQPFLFVFVLQSYHNIYIWFVLTPTIYPHPNLVLYTSTRPLMFSRSKLSRTSPSAVFYTIDHEGRFPPLYKWGFLLSPFCRLSYSNKHCLFLPSDSSTCLLFFSFLVSELDRNPSTFS